MTIFAWVASVYFVGAVLTWCLLGSIVHAEPLDGAPPMVGSMRIAASLFWPVFWISNWRN